MTTLTIPAIKDAKLSLKVLESLNIEPSSILLVVNRQDGHSDFNRDSIEQNLGHKVAAQLPYDARAVGESVTRGAPFVTLQPEAEISRAVREIVGLIVPEPATAGAGAGAGAGDSKPRKRGLFGR